jgi:hypothetical protein
MARQADITFAQVEHKIGEAHRRMNKALETAMAALTADEYDAAIAAGCKAANDYRVWKKVHKALR